MAEEHAGHHDPHLAHHFESHKQQFDSGKLGMWLFLAQEILFFSGLFVAYIIYRSFNPEIFIEGAKHLDTTLGALNTAVLILSSLTMAWGVRAAQLNQQKLLLGMLAATFALAGAFLVVKYFEYTHKFEQGLYPGKFYSPHESSHAPMTKEEAAEVKESGNGHLSISDMVSSKERIKTDSATSAHVAGSTSGSPSHEEGGHAIADVDNMQIFYSIYYCMTGLHALHIIAGMIAIAWLFVRASKGHFNSNYFGPVDFVGLYWHLVDLIWIYLFPLLYLIQ